ncbi:exopolysaccharide biosynthesis polyprenyl glycosylphosphotransferase [Oceanotoga teriensis]|uniref:exopolysaccharide biosynthesis polyprenyl glycosylphosphotransferase n=1 Tax=Oceanotoga teriensis TaxID=515440 RepID=UPI0027139E62|nr:exopolysaccharide biosynthesis polyprenyl glycosylphosphotransferase [Oceanotoga teriensis]MDO7975863.1 exopolysaccharide biosynthesis polyprenyl glycosylphosphotransferase [Oceanotoga teriensis]
MKRLVKILDFILFFIFNLTIGLNPLTSLIISSIFLIGIYAFRTYDTETMNSLNETIIRVIAGNFVSIIGITLFHSILGYSISKVFLYNFIFNIILIPTIHKIEYMIYIKKAPEKRYLVIGRKNEIGHILDEISKKTHGKYKFVKYINPSAEKLIEILTDEFDFENNRILNTISTNKLNSIVVTDPKLENLVFDNIKELKRRGIKIEYLPNMSEKHLKRIPLEVFDRFNEYYRVTFENVRETPTKRILDMLISSVALVILSPFMLIIALMIFFEDKLPIIFTQERVGLHEESFKMHKFRNMKNRKNEEAKFATDEQDRVLKIGKIIRPIRLDETLQFYDILRGAMSFVGPRPEQVKFVEEYNEMLPQYYARHKLKTGLTGWAQIMYQYSATLEQTKVKLSYDLYYVKNRNILLDLQIILKTFEAVVWKRGAV